jgi:hypothetical protein
MKKRNTINTTNIDNKTGNDAVMISVILETLDSLVPFCGIGSKKYR